MTKIKCSLSEIYLKILVYNLANNKLIKLCIYVVYEKS